MHARARGLVNDKNHKYRGQQITATVDGKEALEYEGLRGGELAWVLGRRMVHRGNGVFDMPRDGDRPLHMNASVLGEGVNRMQRLASTGWMEAMFANRFSDDKDNPNPNRTIDLVALDLTKESCNMLDSELNKHKDYLYGSTALYSTNVAQVLLGHDVAKSSLVRAETAEHANELIMRKYGGNWVAPVVVQESVKDRGLQHGGLDVLQTGPFLCGYMTGTFDRVVANSQEEAKERGTGGTDLSISSIGTLIEFTQTIKAAEEGAADQKRLVSMPLDSGDVFAQSALEAEMRALDMMDWTPDGLILSKLASPAGDALAQEQLDAQSAQLFNVAVQGPALSTAWTSDLNGQKEAYRLACHPMDKVFVCIVATLAYSVTGADHQLRQAELAMEEALKRGTQAGGEVDLPQIRRAGEALFIQRQRFAEKSNMHVVSEDAGAEERQKTLENAYNSWGDDSDALKKKEEELREFIEGENGRVAEARLSGFRLMRTTSSHMANFSKFEPSRTRNGANHTRLGLPLAAPKPTLDDDRQITGYTGVGEYIIGGWCVGTVIDSAASRSIMHNQTNTAPASMAMNVHVNIEWWSAGKLHNHYMDTRVRARGGVKPTQKRKRKTAGAGPENASGGVIYGYGGEEY